MNAGDSSAGTVTLLGATQNSVNTVYAQLVTELDGGPSDVVEMARRLGIRSKLDPFCSITLGSVAVNPLEMTNAYATIANHGYLNKATPICEIARSNGDVFLKTEPTKRDFVLRPKLADQVTYALGQVVAGGTGPRQPCIPITPRTARPAPRRTTWRRGSADTPRSSPPACGSATPRDPRPLVNIEGVPSVYGGTIPAAIWQEYMLNVMNQYYDKGGDPYPYPELTGWRGPSVVVSSPAPPSPSPTETESPEPICDARAHGNTRADRGSHPGRPSAGRNLLVRRSRTGPQSFGLGRRSGGLVQHRFPTGR